VLADVTAAFNRVATVASDVVIDRRGIVLPAGGHFQGIQRLRGWPPQLVITSSSNSEAYMVVCDMAGGGARGRARPPVQLAVVPLKHAGGCQSVDRGLVLGVEDNESKTRSEVQLWDLRGTPRRLPERTITRAGRPKVSTAGAVGITSHGDEAVIAVASWDAQTIDFYVSALDPFGDEPPRFILERTWDRDEADRTGWIDEIYAVYQSINLVTDVDGSMFLVGCARNDDGEDWMDLYAIDLHAPPAQTLTKLGTRHMSCTSGCSFGAGSGIYVPSSEGLEVYAVNGSSGPHDSGTTIHVNHFSSQPA
jgi:hypothetical protein